MGRNHQREFIIKGRGGATIFWVFFAGKPLFFGSVRCGSTSPLGNSARGALFIPEFFHIAAPIPPMKRQNRGKVLILDPAIGVFYPKNPAKLAWLRVNEPNLPIPRGGF